MPRPLSLIGAPSSAGAYAPGPERTPSAFRQHGLTAALQTGGREVIDRGDVWSFRWRPDRASPEAMNLHAAVRVASEVADRVEAALGAGEDALVLGGDCSVELGTLAGALRHNPSTGLIYLDLDVDLNPPGKGEGALGWMGVAHMLDLPGAADALSDLGPRRPMLAPQDILFFGADNITEAEQATVERLRLELVRLDDVKANPGEAAARAAAWATRFEQTLIHLDVDVLSFIDFPFAENTRRQAGLTFDELAASLRGLAAIPSVRAVTIAQINPNHAPDEAEAFGRFSRMLAQALGAAASAQST